MKKLNPTFCSSRKTFVEKYFRKKSMCILVIPQHLSVLHPRPESSRNSWFYGTEVSSAANIGYCGEKGNQSALSTQLYNEGEAPVA